MDSHFEVILERVKSLTEKSGMTVWFEIPETLTDQNVLMLINEKNNIGMLIVKYTDKIPSIRGYKLSKAAYDYMTEHGYSTESIEDKAKRETDPKRVVRWIVGNA